MKIRRVTSVIECVIMGCIAFDLMVLLNRIAFKADPFEITGFILPTILGGAVGALVRYYFVRAEQETGEYEIPDHPPSCETPPTEFLNHQQSPEQASPEIHDVAASSCTEPPTPHPESTLPEDTASVHEPIEMPEQIELWPSLVDEHADDGPIQEELQLGLSLWPPPEVWEQPPDTHIPVPPPVKLVAEDQRPDRNEAPEVPPIQARFTDWFMEDASVLCVAINAQDEIVMANRSLSRGTRIFRGRNSRHGLYCRTGPFVVETGRMDRCVEISRCAG